MTGPAPPLELAAGLPTARAGQDWSGGAGASGGVPPYVFTAAGLPAGLTLTPGGQAGGMTSETGRFTVTLTVTDTGGAAATADVPLWVYPELVPPARVPWVTGPDAWTRRYDLIPDRRYRPVEVEVPEPAEPAPPPVAVPPGGVLVPVVWDGLELQHWEDPATSPGGWWTAVVELVTGWYASPPLDGRDAERALADGAAYGHKLLGAREVTITGAAAGPRQRLMAWRDQLAWRATSRQPTELAIGDPQLGTTLTALVRADTDSFTHEFFAGPLGFRYQVTLTAADPLLYGTDWHVAVLGTETAAEAGRRYTPPPQWPRRYDSPPDWPGQLDPPRPAPDSGWGYASPYPPGSAAFLGNRGDADAPVYAAYQGDLGESTLTDGTEQQESTGAVLLEPVPPQVQINVATATLTAEAPGGAPRAQWVRPGSRPLVIPAFATRRWHLYSTGSGRVTLAWRDTWA